MTPEGVVGLFSHVAYLIIMMVSLITVPSMITGLLVSFIQAITQIQEQTLSFLPRFIVTILMVIFTGHWMLRKCIELFNDIFAIIPASLGL